MAELSATPSVHETLPDTMYLVETISSGATSLKLNYVPLAITGGVLILDEGTTREERVSFGTVTDNGDDTATFGDLRRGLAFGGGTAYAASGATAYEHTGNSSTARLVIAHEYLNKMVVTDRASLIASSIELQFGATSQAVYGDATELYFKSSTTAAKTLAQLAAAAGTDEKLKVSIDDTTGDYLLNKLAAGTGIKLTELSGGGDEDAEIGVADLFKLQSDNEKTIDTGAITVTTTVTRVDTESDGASDDLDTISGGTENMIIILRAEHTDRTVVVKHNTGNILLTGGDCTLDDTTKRIVLQYDDNLSKWTEIARSTSTFLTAQSLTTTNKVVHMSGTGSAVLTNPTTNTAFDTHTHSIDANTLINGVGYEFEGIFTSTAGASTTHELSIMLGSTIIATVSIEYGAGGPNPGYFKGAIFGTAAAGASVAVRGGLTFGITETLFDFSAASVNVATDGALTLQLGFKFGTSNGSNTAQILAAKFTQVSSTPFSV